MRLKTHLLNNIKRVFFIVLIILLATSPTNVEAHTSYYLQALVDTDNLLFKAEVIKDKQENENNHLEKQSGDFYGIFAPKMNELHTYVEDGKMDKNTNRDDPMIFNFPPKHIPGHGGFTSHNNATGEDAALAHEIKNTLIPGLNEALIMINNGYAYTDFDAFREAAEALAKGEKPSWSDVSVSCSDSTCTLKPKKGADVVFPRAVEKPYAIAGTEYYKDDYEDDVTEITWESLISHALFMYDSRGVTYQNNSRKVGALEEMIVGVVESAVNGVKSALDLYSIEDLVFNRNLRGQEYVTYKGVFSARSWEAIKTINVICQAIAWSMIGIAIAKLIIKRNWAIITTSPRDNVFFMDMIKDLVLMAFVSLSAFFIIDLALLVNNVFVDVFSGYVGDRRLFLNINGYQGTLANCLIQVFELVVTIYINFVYIYRGFMIAILMAIAPLFIVAMAFGENGKAKTQQWAKELGVNIFIQSFHAIILTFFSLVMANTRGLESLIACMALIPLTSLFKNMILGESGVDKIASNSAQTFTKGVQEVGTYGVKKARNMAETGIGAVSTGAKDGFNAINTVRNNKNKLSEAEASSSRDASNSATPTNGSKNMETSRDGATHQENSTSADGSNSVAGHTANDEANPKGTMPYGMGGNDIRNTSISAPGGEASLTGETSALGAPGTAIEKKALKKSSDISNAASKKITKASLNIGKQALRSGIDAGIGAAGIATGLSISAAYGTPDGINTAKQGMRDIDNAMSDFGGTFGESYNQTTQSIEDIYNHKGGAEAYRSGVESIEKLDDGSYDVATNLKKVAGGSLQEISKNDETGEMTYSFDTKKLRKSDFDEHANKLLEIKKNEGKEGLKAIGVSDIRRQDGKTDITYTKDHMQKLGINGGRVEDDQLIENKSSYADSTAYIGPQFDLKKNKAIPPKHAANQSIGHTEMIMERLREQEASKATGIDEQINW